MIILDDVQNQKTGGSWTNRTVVQDRGKRKWLTVPIRRIHGVQRICDVEISGERNVLEELQNRLESYYSGIQGVHEAVQLFDGKSHDLPRLASLNLHLIKSIGSSLGLDPSNLLLASSLSVDSSGTERLIDLVEAVGGTTYVSGIGSSGYLREELFGARGVGLTLLEPSRMSYPQHGSEGFVPDLSIIDAIANLGMAGVKKRFRTVV